MNDLLTKIITTITITMMKMTTLKLLVCLRPYVFTVSTSTNEEGKKLHAEEQLVLG